MNMLDSVFSGTFVRAIALGLFVLIGGARTPAAASPDASMNEALQALMEAADLVFIGRVMDIRYRNSDQRSPEDAVLPHTFVTYRIEQILHGRHQGDLTLRFLGGPNGIDGRVLLAQTLPLFSRDDRDILMVRGNGQSMCPLVGCVRGRFRVVDDRIYTDRGRGLSLAADGQVLLMQSGLGPDRIRMEVPPAPASYLKSERRRLGVVEDSLDPETYRRQVERLEELSKTRVISLRTRRLPNRLGSDLPAADLDAFVDLLSKLAPKQARPVAVSHLSADQPFYVRRATPVRSLPRPQPQSRRQSVPFDDAGTTTGNDRRGE